MEVDFERAHWEGMARDSRRALDAIREFIDYLENARKALVIASTRLSSEEAIRYIGPSAEVAVAGLAHAIDYLVVCRNMIQETDLVLTTRALARLET